MRVLIDGLSARVGGGVTYLENVLPALERVARHHEFVVLLSERYQAALLDRLPGTFQAAAVPLEAEPLARRWLRLQIHLKRIIRDEDIDLLFAPAENLYRRLPIPIVMMVRNLAIYRPPASAQRNLQLLRFRLLRKPLMHWALRAADELVFVSDAARRDITRSMSLPASAGRVIHHGVDAAFFHPAEAGQMCSSYVLAVSTVTPHKNYEVLVRAFARLARRREFAELQLLIAGDLQDSATAQQLRHIAELGAVADRVHLLGSVAHAELPALYAGAAVFAFPSRLETFGNPLLEAMAAGAPVVAADIATTRELCGDAAVLVDGGSDEALAAGLASVLASGDRRDQMVADGRTRARSFTWTNTAEQLSQTFDEVLQRSKRRAR